MTRINVDLDPKLLTDQHLLAEYREIPMVPAALRRSLKTKSVGDILDSIPKKFTLNRGHVTFFYNKLAFLSDRYSKIVSELESRGVNVDKTRTYGGDGLPYVFYGKASFDSKDRTVLVNRIKTRVQEKPHWYKHRSVSIDETEYFKLLNKGIHNG